MTPHIEAKKEDISSTVIMPGDPKRAKYIAEKFLKDAKCINEVRGMLGYTGYYKDKRITVMAHGMGNPSMGIYSYELFKFYDVENIIRVGSAGSYSPNLKLYDVVLVKESYTDSSYGYIQNGSKDNILKSDDEINKKIKDTAKILNIKLNEGRVYCSDIFYKENDNYENMYKVHNCIAVEMESFALFHNAKVLNKKASCILTISDSLVTKEETTSEQREKSFNQMIELALESAIKD